MTILFNQQYKKTLELLPLNANIINYIMLYDRNLFIKKIPKDDERYNILLNIPKITQTINWQNNISCKIKFRNINAQLTKTENENYIIYIIIYFINENTINDSRCKVIY